MIFGEILNRLMKIFGAEFPQTYFWSILASHLHEVKLSGGDIRKLNILFCHRVLVVNDSSHTTVYIYIRTCTYISNYTSVSHVILILQLVLVGRLFVFDKLSLLTAIIPYSQDVGGYPCIIPAVCFTYVYGGLDREPMLRTCIGCSVLQSCCSDYLWTAEVW